MPARAVLRSPMGAMVWVVGAQDKVEPRPVEAGQTVGNDVVINKGLKSGERVIVDGVIKVQPGAQVKPVATTVAAAPARAGASPQQPEKAPAARSIEHGSQLFHRSADIRVRHLRVHPDRGARRLHRAAGLPVSRTSCRPEVQVTAFYPGASAEVVAETVAAPLEQSINGVENMLYVHSSSSSSGQLTLAATFDVGTDPDLAIINVKNRVQAALPLLPEEVRRQGVKVIKRSPTILLVIGMQSPDKSRDALFVSNYTLVNVVDEIRRIPGVGSATDLRRQGLCHPHLAAAGQARAARADSLRRRSGGARAERAVRRRTRRRHAGQ